MFTFYDIVVTCSIVETENIPVLFLSTGTYRNSQLYQWQLPVLVLTLVLVLEYQYSKYLCGTTVYSTSTNTDTATGRT
jgi:hypothetical protein